MSLQVGLHDPKRALFLCGPSFGATIQFSDAQGQSVILYMPYEAREAARCIAEYFNDSIAPPPAPPINPEDDDDGA